MPPSTKSRRTLRPASSGGRWPRTSAPAPNRRQLTARRRRPARTAKADQGSLSSLVRAAQNALPTRFGPKAGVRSSSGAAAKVGPALAVLAAGAGALVGGRQLQKRRPSAGADGEPAQGGAPRSAPPGDGFPAPLAVSADPVSPISVHTVPEAPAQSRVPQDHDAPGA